MTLNREQIRRDAKLWMTDTTHRPADRWLALPHELAFHCLALLDELEQAERNYDRCVLMQDLLVQFITDGRWDYDAALKHLERAKAERANATREAT